MKKTPVILGALAGMALTGLLMSWGPAGSPAGPPGLVLGDNPPGSRPVVPGPPGSPPEDPRPDESPPTPTPPPVERIPCDFPSIRGVPEFNVKVDQTLQVSPTGGQIVPGKYQLTGAVSSDPKKADGLWTILLDLASDGQGAFYRRAGLRRLSSRIDWQTEGDELSFVTLCPDLQPTRMSFRYSAGDQGLTLVTEDGVVLSFERFEDSRVEGMSRPQKLPAGKVPLAE